MSNRRTDEYGGSFENRVRFPLEVVRRVRRVIEESGQEVPLLYRVSASDWVDGGWDIDETVKLAALLRDEGIDLLDVSSAGNTPQQKIKVGPGYQVHFAAEIKAKVPGLLVGSVGMIWRAALATEVIEAGKADVVLVAREFLRDPSLVLTWAKELGVVVKYPIQYHRAAHPPQGAKFIGAGDAKDGTHGVGGKEASKAADQHHGQSGNKL